MLEVSSSEEMGLYSTRTLSHFDIGLGEWDQKKFIA